MGVVFAYKPCMSFYKLNFLDIFFNFILNLFIFGWRLITVLCCFCHISYVISRLLVILNVNNCQGGVLIFWNFLEVFFFFLIFCPWLVESADLEPADTDDHHTVPYSITSGMKCERSCRSFYLVEAACYLLFS